MLELDLNDELHGSNWLYEADYEVGYNKNGLLSITLSMDGSGAYPDGTSKAVVVDLKTGNRVRAGDVFTNLVGLAAMVRKAQRIEVAKSMKETKTDPDNKDVDPYLLFKGASFTVKDLNEFEVSDNGVTFIYDYGFAHVMQALNPKAGSHIHGVS